MTDPNRYKDLYNFDDQISFQRRQCEATEKVANNIARLNVIVTAAAFGIIITLWIVL